MQKEEQEKRLAYYMQRLWDTTAFIQYASEDEKFHDTVDQLVENVLESRNYPTEATPLNVDWRMKVKNRFSFMYWAQKALSDPEFNRFKKEFESEDEKETFMQAANAYIKSNQPYKLRLEHIDQTMDIRIQMLQSPEEWKRKYIPDDELVVFLDNEMDRVKELLISSYNLVSLSQGIAQDLIDDDLLDRIEESIFEATKDDVVSSKQVENQFKEFDIKDDNLKPKLYRMFIHFLFQRANRFNDEISIKVDFTSPFDDAEKWKDKIKSTKSTSELYDIYTQNETDRPISLMNWLEETYLLKQFLQVTKVDLNRISEDELIEQFSEEIPSLSMMEV